MPQRRLVVRRYRAKLTDNQLELLSATIEAQNGLFNPSDHAKHITLGVDPTLLVVKA